MIYFLQPTSGGRIKIGTTRRLADRLVTLCAEIGDNLRVLAVIDGSFSGERRLHRRFAHLRTVGEWFEPGDDLLGFIVEEGKPWDVNDPGNARSIKKAAQPPPVRRVALQACEAWIAWLEEGADHCRTDVSKLLDVAAASYLRSQGFTKPPPKRVP